MDDSSLVEKKRHLLPCYCLQVSHVSLLLGKVDCHENGSPFPGMRVNMIALLFSCHCMTGHSLFNPSLKVRQYTIWQSNWKRKLKEVSNMSIKWKTTLSKVIERLITRHGGRQERHSNDIWKTRTSFFVGEH